MVVPNNYGFSYLKKTFWGIRYYDYMGVSLNGGFSPQKNTPSADHFSRKTHSCWGNPPF